MLMLSLKENVEGKRLPIFVHDIYTANCVFCPYGTDGVEVGDRVYAYDEQTILGRRQRERLVEVTAIKAFRSTGRIVTLDIRIATALELKQIAENSEVPLQALIDQCAGAETFDPARPPVVVYFRPCDEDATVSAQQYGLSGQSRFI
ncbi:MAG: hypothetical protein ACREJM_03370 [Candidatus Saccharimonadales bacterium]